jgi:hypothetical protein
MNTKNSISSSKILIVSEQETPHELMHKKEFNFNDLINKYKFNL